LLPVVSWSFLYDDIKFIQLCVRLSQCVDVDYDEICSGIVRVFIFLVILTFSVCGSWCADMESGLNWICATPVLLCVSVVFVFLILLLVLY